MTRSSSPARPSLEPGPATSSVPNMSGPDALADVLAACATDGQVLMQIAREGY